MLTLPLSRSLTSIGIVTFWPVLAVAAPAIGAATAGAVGVGSLGRFLGSYCVVHYIRVDFFQTLEYRGIKRRGIFRWFQKYKPTSLTKCTYKKLFLKSKKFTMCFWNYFLGAFCRKCNFIFFNYVKFCVF
jgi:hypothetical protein